MGHRVLLITDDMGQGGAERQIAYLAIGLKKRGHDVRLIRFYNGVNAYAEDLAAAGINLETFTNGRPPYKRPFVIAGIVRRWRPDLVIAYKDGACMGACLARMFVKFRLIVSERNTTQVLSRKEKLKFLLFRLADKIVPNSFSQARFIKDHCTSLAPKTTVITNMVDVDKFHPATEPPQNNPLRFITTARIAPQKNILNYLQAIAELKRREINCHFDWFGQVQEPQYQQQIQSLITELDIADMVTFHGGSDNVADCYRKTDAFILPSLYEGFPNVLCEAMASGLPAVASAVCDNPSILANPDRLFDPENPVDMADKITAVLNLSTEERIAEGFGNRRFVIDLCSPDAFIDKYEFFFND